LPGVVVVIWQDWLGWPVPGGFSASATLAHPRTITLDSVMARANFRSTIGPP